MQEEVRIENLSESNVDDLIYVCSSKKLNDPVHQQGIRLKRQWLLQLLKKHGSVAKIAYHKGTPVAQILFYPEESDVTKPHARKGVVTIQCIYNPTSEAQKLGIGTRLLQRLVSDCRHRRSCLGNMPCRFISAKAFSAGEALSLAEFYKKNGFAPTSEFNTLFLPIEGDYEPLKPVGDYQPLPEDRNKAVVFYSPTCEFSYTFARKIEELVREAAPNIKIELVNEWENPEESIKRKNWWLIVNAKPIHTFFMDTEKFKTEVRNAANNV